MKRLIISILVGIVSALILAQAYCYYLHPEINFYRKAIAISSKYEEKLRNEGHNIKIEMMEREDGTRYARYYL